MVEIRVGVLEITHYELVPAPEFISASLEIG